MGNISRLSSDSVTLKSYTVFAAAKIRGSGRLLKAGSVSCIFFFLFAVTDIGIIWWSPTALS